MGRLSKERTQISDAPQTIVQAGGKVAENIVSGLANTPTLLLIMLLNVTMIGAAAYFLSAMEERRHATNLQLAELLKLCIAPDGHPNAAPRP